MDQFRQLEQELGRSKADRIRRFDIFGLQQLQDAERALPYKSKESSRGNDKKGAAMPDMSSEGMRLLAEQKNIETQTEIASEPGLPELKKKNFKFMKRFSIMNNSNNLIKTLSDGEEKPYRIQQIFEVCVEPTPKAQEGD